MDGCKKQIRENVIEHLHKLGYEVFNNQLIYPENLDCEHPIYSCHNFHNCVTFL